MLRELTARKIDEKITGSDEVARELGEVYDLVLAQFDNILKLLEERDIFRLGFDTPGLILTVPVPRYRTW